MRSAFNNRGYRPYHYYSNPQSTYDEQDGTDLQSIRLWRPTGCLSKSCLINNSENQFADMPKAKSSMLYSIPLGINSCTNDMNNLFQNYCVYQANGYMACSKSKTTIVPGNHVNYQ